MPSWRACEKGRVNSFFEMLGIEGWKPILTALLLPPVPLLVLLLVGARLMLPRRGLGWFLILVSVSLLWLSSTSGAARAVSRLMLNPPAALSATRVVELRAEAKAKGAIAIVVLGGGVEPFAPEYGISNLQWRSLERLRYGIWLGRETGVPVAFSGGVGWAQGDAPPEARVAARIAEQEFGRPLKWVEDNSRDTRENAARSVVLLKAAGITHIVLVTHGWHMPRALRAFAEAAGDRIRIEAAPMGLAQRTERPSLDWFPSSTGFGDMRSVLREIAGRFLGA